MTPPPPTATTKPGRGRVVAEYHYTDETGKLLYVVERRDPKDFRQKKPNGGGWDYKLNGVRRVPYRLPELLAADPCEWVFVVEGEKDADRLAGLGLVATTNAQGAEKWHTIDPTTIRTAFNDRPVVIIPDNDDAGRRHVDQVGTSVEPVAASVQVLTLPGLPERGDVSDWLDAGGTPEELLRIAAAAPAWVAPAGRKFSSPDPSRNDRPHDRNDQAGGRSSAAARTYRPVPAHIPFPTYLLPEPLTSLTRQAAEAIGCDEAFVAVPALAVAAAAIGNSRHIRLKRGWDEPSVIWAAVVGESGTRKSPPFRVALRPLWDAELRFRAEFAGALAKYNAMPAEAKADQTANPKPVRRRVLTEDVTIESLAGIQLDNPRGLINARDEIEDWFQSQVRYKGKAGGSDRSRWIQQWSAGTMIVDRKHGDPDTRNIAVPLASCCIVGTIQPGVLAAALDHMARESGLAARLLLVMPDYRSVEWTEVEVDLATLDAYADLVRDLLTLPMAADLLTRRQRPEVLTLDAEAKGLWVPWYNRLQDEKAVATTERRAVLAKLEAYAARFALIFHVVTEVAAGRGGLDPVTADAVNRGTQLSEWFITEADRIAARLCESEADREVRELVEWIRRRGGRCMARDLYGSLRRTYPTADDARTALDILASLGLGAWEKAVPPKGGHVIETFVLTS